MTAATTALQQVLAREHRLSALDGLAAAAAHQLGTPLGTIGLIAKELQSSPLAQGEFAEDLKSLHTEALRCREILSSLTAQSDQGDTVFSQMHLSALLQEVMHEAGGHDVPILLAIELGGETEPYVRRQPEIIYGLGNLAENAAEFAETEVRLTANISADKISVCIADDGPGFSGEVMMRLGEPWITSRPLKGDVTAQSGMGLGFFIAKTMLERTGGSVQVENRRAPEHGARITVTWPRRILETSLMPAS